jgi:hypothetical protein
MFLALAKNCGIDIEPFVCFVNQRFFTIEKERKIYLVISFILRDETTLSIAHKDQHIVEKRNNYVGMFNRNDNRVINMHI